MRILVEVALAVGGGWWHSEGGAMRSGVSPYFPLRCITTARELIVQ